MGELCELFTSGVLCTLEQSLRDGDLPAVVKEEWAGQGAEPQFHLRLRASGIIRVQHRLTGDQEVGHTLSLSHPTHHTLFFKQQTFRSLIVTPHMTSGDVVQVALGQIAPQEDHTHYHLIEKTPHRGGHPHTQTHFTHD